MLEGTNQNPQDLDDLDNKSASLENVFQGLESDWLRRSALEKTLCYIRPIAYHINTDEKVLNIHGNPILRRVESNGQYIPMQKVLKGFLELPGVLPSILNNIETVKNSRDYTNIIQSLLWKKIESNFENKIVSLVLLL